MAETAQDSADTSKDTNYVKEVSDEDGTCFSSNSWLLEPGGNKAGPLPFLWWLIFTGFFALFIFLIFWQIEARPLHHDEGVNCWFMDRLIEKNLWNYDPENYHGPILYFTTLLYVWVNNLLNNRAIDDLNGLSVMCIRSVPATVGILFLLAIAFGTRHRLGNLGSLLAFILAGFCNDQLWISRYFIHENFFTFFTFAMYICGTKYLDTKSTFWVMLLFASMSFCHASKEFAIVHLTILILADFCSRLSLWLLGETTWPFDRTFFMDGARHVYENFFGLLLGVVAFVIVWFPLFSSFGNNYQGLIDSVRTYSYWGKEGWGESGHNKPFWWWINSVLPATEQGPFLGAILSSGVALWKRERKGLMMMFWFLGFLGCYSILPYKTIWCVPCILLPMIMLTAYATTTVIQTIVESPSIRGKRAACVAIFALLAASIVVDWTRVTYDLNYVRWDANDVYPQPYVHTTRDVFKMVKWIDEAAAASGKGENLPLRFTCDAYHPLPFYLQRKYKFLTWGISKETPDRAKVAGADILVCDQRHSATVRQFLTEEFYDSRKYHVRPGADVEMFVRRRLFSENETGKELEELVAVGPKNESMLVKGLSRSVYSGSDYGVSGNLLAFQPSNKELAFFYGMTDARPFNSPFSYVWNGFVNVEVPGIYEFFLGSDDGSLLYLDGKLIIDNDGGHAFIESSGKAKLTKGLHQIEVKYMDLLGDIKFTLEWKPPNAKREKLPVQQLRSFPDDMGWRQWLIIGEADEEGEEKKSQQQQEQLFVYGGKRLVPGLLRLVCGGSSFCSEGAATHSVSENHTKFEKTTEKEGAALHSSPFSAVWKGFLRIQHEGTYTFKLDSDDGSILYLDGRLLVETDGETQQASTQLAKGFFKFVLGYFDLGADKKLQLAWKRDDQEFKPIPASAFYTFQDPVAFSADTVLPVLLHEKGATMLSSVRAQVNKQNSGRLGVLLGPIEVYPPQRGEVMRSLSQDTAIKYCALWGYDFFSTEKGTLRVGLSIIQNMEQKWDAGYEWLVWLNYEVLFTNPRQQLLEILDAHATDNTQLVFSRDQHGKIMTGLLAVRVSERSKELLKDWKKLLEASPDGDVSDLFEEAINQADITAVLSSREILSFASRQLRNQPQYPLADLPGEVKWQDGDLAVWIKGCLPISRNDEAACNGVATNYWHHFRVELESFHRESQQREGVEPFDMAEADAKNWLLAFPADQCGIPSGKSQ